MRGLAAAAVVGFVLALFANPSDARAATCTFEQKQARAATLAQHQRSAASARRAYFKRHTSAKQRAAFVKTQQKKLRALRAAAGCVVPPLPPSSGQSCSFMLAPNAENARLGGGIRGPLFNEGPIPPEQVMPSRGRINAVMLFVDFPDRPGGTESLPAIGATHTAALPFFEEASYGRFSLSVTRVDRWLRMPEPATAYDPLSLHQHRLMGQAIAAADPTVDFSQYQFVFFVGAQGAILGNRGYAMGAGYGYRADGNELRFAAILDPSVRRFGNGAAYVLNHEFAHPLGLPDLGGFVSGWDPMGPSGNQWPSGAHFLGWHKWKLGWLDPPQLTCLHAPGQLEETLTPIAVAGGKKIVIVPITDSLAYVVEARRHIGYDRDACEEGILVYTVNSQLLNSEGAVVVKGPAACGVGSPGALATGEAHDDELVKVEVLATDGRDYRVRVTKK